MVGAILIVIGLYSVLWGKHKEQIESKMEDDIPLPVKGAQISGNGDPENDASDHFTEAKSGEKGEANNKLSSVVISMTNQEAKA